MLGLVASLVVGSALLLASGAKLADRAGSVVALGTYGFRPSLVAPAWAALVVVEAGLGFAVAAGSAAAAAVAAGMLLVFAAAQGAALASGRAGAPCGCLGGRGRLSAAAVARTTALAAAAAVAALFTTPAGTRPAVLVACVAVAAAVLFLTNRRPDGALDVDGEGPQPGMRLVDPDDAPWRVLLFTSDSCRLCARVRRGLRRAAFPVVELDETADAQLWLTAEVPGAPYAVVVDAAGVVVAKGTVNSATQVRSLVPVAAPAGADSRRAFLVRAGGMAAAVTGAASVGKLVAPGEAEAYHFCGHIYTTDGCPHPTGLPRIDARGFPLRASDGHPVDDLGRLIERDGTPIDEEGAPLLGPDGEVLPPATRTRVCTAVARERAITTRVDGAWYRCCKGRVRKLVDCCSTNPQRINGDKALRGYCYGKRKVFCVMYFQTKVPC